MNSIDLLILAVVVGSTLLGFYWGLIRQILAVFGLVVGILAASRLGPTVAGWLTSFVGNDRLAVGLGFVVVLVTVMAVSSLVASALRLFVGLLFLGWLDHTLGALLGFAKAALLCAAFIAIVSNVAGSSVPSALLDSRVSHLLVQRVVPLLPPLGLPKA